MGIKRKLLILIVSVLAVGLFSGCGSSSSSTSYKISLEVWGLFDESTSFDSFITKYKSINPYIADIKYKKLSSDSYQQDILDALASGQGPDIILIQNTWLPSFENKLAPAPAAVTNEQEVRSNFVDVVADNFMDGSSLYAVPLSADSLALYYNKDLFNAAGITNPPKTWDEFVSDSIQLTKISPTGEIIQSGAALGTSQNISGGAVNRATDILSLLMYQNGVTLPTASNPRAAFEQGTIGANGQPIRSGANALNFYTQFARIGMPAYSWSPRMHYSIDAFAEGSTAMMLNYSWQLNTLRSQNPKLNFAVAPVPQLNPSSPVDYANYWAFAVTKNKMEPVDATGQGGGPMTTAKNQARIHEAWEFLKFLTMKNNGNVHLSNALTGKGKDFPMALDPAAEYLKKTEKPAARRDLIEVQKSDPDLAPFAVGNLIAKSWYQADPDAADAVMSQMIDTVVNGGSIDTALGLASNRIDALNRKK